MTTVYPLIQIITRLSALTPMLSQWETCALNLIERYRPSSVFFSCKSSQLCLDNNVYKALQVPSQTVFGLESDELPAFPETDLVFLLDNRVVTWNNETVFKYRRKGGTSFKIVIVAKMSDNIKDDFRSMKDLFAGMWLSGIVRCAVILVNDTTSQVYTYLPFKDGQSCEDTTPVLLGECTEVVDDVFDLTYKIFNLNQCPIRMAFVDDRPLYSSNKLGFGKLFKIFTEIAHRMNASIQTIQPTSGHTGLSCGPKEFTGTRGMAWDGTAHMAVGSFNQQECSKLQYISLPIVQCLGWCVPVLPAKDYVFLFIIKQLQPRVWFALIISVIVVSIIVLVLCAISCERWTSSHAFNLALVLYAQPPLVEPRASSIRLVVVVWLLACLVMRTAYEGELKSISSLRMSYHIIHNVAELPNMNIGLCSTFSNVQVLMKLKEIPIIQKIIQKIAACNGTLYDNMVAAAKLGDRAVFTSDLRCIAVAAELRRQNLYLLPLRRYCIKTFQLSPIITFPGSPFKQRWASVLERCAESGLVWKWLDVKVLTKGGPRARPNSLHHLLPALFVLSVGCSLALLSFVCEKTYSRRSKCIPKCK